MKIRNEMPVAEVRERFDYDPETGILTRRMAVHGRQIGEVLGSPGMDGYLRCRASGLFYYVHRLAWAHYHGYWPEETDHIDGNRANNRIANLRECSHSQNCHNRPKFNGKQRKNATGVKGVFLSQSGTFRATIKVDKRSIYIGQYKTLAEATEARKAAANRLVGEFARH